MQQQIIVVIKTSEFSSSSLKVSGKKKFGKHAVSNIYCRYLLKQAEAKEIQMKVFKRSAIWQHCIDITR